MTNPYEFSKEELQEMIQFIDDSPGIADLTEESKTFLAFASQNIYDKYTSKLSDEEFVKNAAVRYGRVYNVRMTEHQIKLLEKCEDIYGSTNFLADLFTDGVYNEYEYEDLSEFFDTFEFEEDAAVRAYCVTTIFAAVVAYDTKETIDSCKEEYHEYWSELLELIYDARFHENSPEIEEQKE